MPLDTHTEHSPTAPWNQKETEQLSELEQLQEEFSNLRSKMQKAKEQLTYCIDLANAGNNDLLKNNLLKIKL